MESYNESIQRECWGAESGWLISTVHGEALSWCVCVGEVVGWFRKASLKVALEVRTAHK